MGYIYLRTNLINGKCYVGQTVDVEKRNYDWQNLNWRYGGYPINNARKKYGTDGFSFELLKECPNEDMNFWEMYYIKMYNSKKPYGYNSTDGGDSTYERSEETRKKISEALKGKPNPKVAAALRGRKRSAEAVAKVAAANRGKKRPAEVVAKIAAANKNNPKYSKAVQALDKVTGEVVMEFPSAMEAQRQGGFNSGHVGACCRGERKSHKGYIWRFAS